MKEFGKKELSETYCPLPFNHLYVSEKGEVKPCCVSKGFKSKPNVNIQDLDTIYNNKDFITLRQSLTTNKKPSTCNVCWEQEAVDADSHRLRNIRQYKTHIPTMNLRDDTIVEVQFEDIDIRFSNICNLKCVMCGPESSHLHNNGKIVKIKDGFLDDLKPKLHNLKRIYFAGGEPLIMDEHYEILDYLSRVNNGIKISYSTNLQILEKGKYKVLELWSRFKHKPYVAVSCDGLYELGEKIRTGFSTDKFIKNVKLLEQNNIPVTISYTVGTYNALEIPLFIDQINNLGIQAQITFSNYVQYPTKYSIQSLSRDVKENVANKLNNLNSSNKEFSNLIKYMFKIKNVI